MTNGEKLKEVFPYAQIDYHKATDLAVEHVTMVINDFLQYYPKWWWDSEYKEPTTKKCNTCKYREIDGKKHEMCKSCICGDRYEQELTTKNNLGVREFEKIEVTYPSEEVCIYPEYKGKPYFGIKYKENGESIVGYGTYKPEVLSQYLKDYFISTIKNDLGVDCISRVDAIKAMEDKAKKLTNEDTINGLCGAVAILYELPPSTPQEPKKGALDTIRQL